ncbi:MAG: acyltransferase family protein [Muribaculaceae bacterium]|nr:acyltransferase family protein [Muribaculaceae bacterium]
MTDIVLISVTVAVLVLLSVITRTNKLSADSGELLSFPFTNSMRGVAILMILVGHISGVMGIVALNPLASTGVTLFLILSGYGLNESFRKHGLRHFWRKKILRVLLPYSFVFIALAVFNHNTSPLSWALNLLGLRTSYWYIAFIIKCYLIFWLASVAAPPYRLWIMTLLSVGLFFIGGELEAPQSFSFLFGVALSHSAISPSRLRNATVPKILLRPASIACLTFVIGTMFLAIKQIPYVRAEYYGSMLYDLIQLLINLPYAVSVMFALYGLKSFPSSRFLLFTGSISYELYLIHFPFYTSVEKNLIYIALFFAGSYLFSYIYQRFIAVIEHSFTKRLIRG